jgi:hypothetical protein
MTTTLPVIAQSLPPELPPNLPDRWTLPTPPGAALPLVLADFENAAMELGVETAVVRAVAQVESGGRTGFDDKKRPLIRYEPHIFRDLTDGQFDADHPDLSTAYQSAQYWVIFNYDYDEMWDALSRAFELAPEQAVMCCSWGMFQVLGQHALKVGWTDLKWFVSDMFYSENQHLRAFLGYCRSTGIVGYLRDHDWANFALGYNGGDYRRHNYDGKIADAYAQFSQ